MLSHPRMTLTRIFGGHLAFFALVTQLYAAPVEPPEPRPGLDVEGAYPLVADEVTTPVGWPSLRELFIERVESETEPTTPTLEMFYLAAVAGDQPLLARLQEHGNINVMDTTGVTTALNIAVLDRHTTAVRHLLVAGANPDSFDRSAGAAALHDAVHINSVEAVAYLLQAHADPDVRNWGLEQAPLHAAVTEGPIEIVELLLAAGADPNVVEGHGVTPLHLAVQAGATTATRLLLEAGADPTIKTDHGVSALDVAGRESVNPVMRTLIEKYSIKESDRATTTPTPAD